MKMYKEELLKHIYVDKETRTWCIFQLRTTKIHSPIIDDLS